MWYDDIIPPVTLVVGKRYVHPTDGIIEITGGCYRDPIYNRISNWWNWKKADGAKGAGYGDNWPAAPT